MDTSEPAEAASNPDEWGRLRGLFDEGVSLAPDDREAWLAGLEDLDDALEEELRALLDSFDPSISLEVEGLPRIAGVFAPSGPEPGDHVGPYEIEAFIGRGGMGRVFRAKQARTDRAVALKIMSHPFPSRRSIHRFEIEAQVLARLSHPNIAHIYEAGVIEAGGLFVPWYAMELVASGTTLRNWIDQAKPLGERLELFLQVCAGVQHAHQRGVLHRDIKPHNVLVDEDGRARLIDFGIAKLLGQETAGSVATSPGQLVGTVAYMSPEQAEGQIIELDARSDQYALGVVMFELLSGELPHTIDGLAVPAAVHKITSEAPSLSRLESAGVSSDLRIIVAKALARAPEERYMSVGALAQDVRRALDGEPILARPPTPGYLLRRFARRKPVLVGVAALALLGLLVGAAGLAVGFDQARAATQVAQLERERAEEMRERAERAEHDALWARDFITQLLGASDPGTTMSDGTTVAELLESASGIMDSSEDPAPSIELRSRLVLAQIYLDLGEPGASLEQIEAAKALLETEPGLEDERPQLQRLRVDALLDLGRVAAAMPLAQQAVALHQAQFGDDDPRTWDAELGYARALELGGELRSARRLLERVSSDCVDELGAKHPDTLEVEAELGLVLFALGEFSTAEHKQRGVWQTRLTELGANHPSTLAALSDLLGTLVQQSQLEQAAQLFPGLITAAEQSLGADSQVANSAVAEYAVVLRRLGRAQEALPLADRAKAIAIERHGPDHVDALRQQNNVALILHELERNEEAERLWLDTLERWRSRPPDAEGSRLVAVLNYARLLERTGRGDEAAALLTEALERAQRDYEEGHWLVALTERRLARMRGVEPATHLFTERARITQDHALPNDLGSDSQL